MDAATPLGRSQEEAGAVFGDFLGQPVARHFGDPEGEYRAAIEGCGVSIPPAKRMVMVSGRSPGEMIQGILTNSLPDPLVSRGPEVLAGRDVYAALLTPKGRMITDLWAGWLGTTHEAGLLLEIPGPGATATLEHLRRSLPPRLAKTTDRSEELMALQVMGIAGPEMLSRFALGFRVESNELMGMSEGEVVTVGSHPGSGIRLRRIADLSTPCWEIITDPPTARGLWKTLLTAGAVPIGAGVTETLRIEAGRPAYGQDMDEATILMEAGIELRALDNEKGCYTGQEVIVRIRDRGHVNRHLRGLRFGTEVAVAPGTDLYAGEEGRSVGVVTSEALSPRVGQTLGLGYVRREVETPGVVHLGGPDGPRVEVRELGKANWAFD